MAHHRDTSSDSQVATEDDHSPESSGDLSPSLPQYTRVLIVGNNRTKRALIGQKAMVKKAVGLGGWHLLVLANGEEVRLQRNALAVLDDNSADQDFSSAAQRKMFAAGDSTSETPSSSHARKPSHHHGSSHSNNGRINFLKLETTALKRYRKVFNLMEVGPNSSKEQLATAVDQHFKSQSVDEMDVLMSFMLLRHKRDRSHH